MLERQCKAPVVEPHKPEARHADHSGAANNVMERMEGPRHHFGGKDGRDRATKEGGQEAPQQTKSRVRPLADPCFAIYEGSAVRPLSSGGISVWSAGEGIGAVNRAATSLRFWMVEIATLLARRPAHQLHRT
jgi:hypothetical protein